MDLVTYNIPDQIIPNQNANPSNPNEYFLDIAILIMAFVYIILIAYSGYQLVRRQIFRRRPMIPNPIGSPVVLRPARLRRLH